MSPVYTSLEHYSEVWQEQNWIALDVERDIPFTFPAKELPFRVLVLDALHPHFPEQAYVVEEGSRYAAAINDVADNTYSGGFTVAKSQG